MAGLGRGLSKTVPVIRRRALLALSVASAFSAQGAPRNPAPGQGVT
jgi:hypothetical protein